MHVLVVDDIAVNRQALANALGRETSIESVHAAADLDTALAYLREDVGGWTVLISMTMADSAEVLKTIVRAAPKAAVIVLAVSEDDVDWAEAGAVGYLLRNEPLSDLFAVMDSTARGETRCSPRVTAMLVRRVAMLAGESRMQATTVHLTAREHEVLRLVDEGLSNKQIARRLSIELRTVKNHVHRVLEKLQVHRRDDAVAKFRATDHRQ